MKKLSLTFLGDVHIASYGVFLDNVGLETVVQNALMDENDETRCMARVALTIEPVTDAGLSVEVMDA